MFEAISFGRRSAPRPSASKVPQDSGKSTQKFGASDTAQLAKSNGSKLFLGGGEVAQTNRAALTERDGLVKLLHALQPSSEPALAELNERARNLWFQGDFRKEKLKSFYEHIQERAANIPTVKNILNDLFADLDTSKPLPTYHENLSGRFFDSAFADELVKSPPAAVIAAAQKAGREMFENIRTSKFPAEVLADLSFQIRRDQRPWFTSCPEVHAFLREPTLAHAHAMFTKVRHGHDAIKAPYLVVRSSWALQSAGQTPDWLRKADAHFRYVVGPERTTSECQAIQLMTKRAGILLHYQAKGSFAQANFMRAKSWADDKLPRFDNMSEFEKNALMRGHAVVNGASGSANILGFFHRDLAARDNSHSVADAMLNTMMFLVYDGGHSVHEVAAVDAMITKAAGHHGDQFTAAESTRLRNVLSNYELDYRHFSDSSTVNPEAIQLALYNALDRTVAHMSGFQGENITTP